MRTGDWLRLVSSHRYDIHPLRWPMFVAATGCAAVNSILGQLQQLLLGHRIVRTQVHDSPLFILGHWRSGTTYLHELLSLDERFNWPTTYQCFAPHHFLLTQWLLTRLILIPRHRPMDNVRLGWHQPQEDEFALCVMGMPSPYCHLAFPNHEPKYLKYLDMTDISEGELEQWKGALSHFLRLVSLRNPKRLLLKSPTHTGRIKVLLELFPKARFVHIVRDPFAVVPSTLRLWQALSAVQGLQLPKHEDLVSYVFDCFQRMYRGFFASQEIVDGRQICTVRYEDLVSDPVAEIEAVYQHLELGDFADVLPRLEQVAESAKEYRTNQYEISPWLRDQIAQHCAQFIDQYGYSQEPVYV